MRSASTLALALALSPCISGCFGTDGRSSGTADEQHAGGSGSTPEEDEPTESAAKPGGACAAPSYASSDFEPFTSTGKATLKLEGKTHELGELRCQTWRNEDGEVFGYKATFSDMVPVPSMHAGVYVPDGYAGDGPYETFAFWERGAGYDAEWDDLAVTLTLTDAGRRGVAESEDGSYRLEYECDIGDDVAAKASALFAQPAAGTAHVTGANNHLVTFEGLTCTRNPVSGEFVVEGPATAGNDDLYRFYLRLDAAKPGKRQADLWFNYYAFTSALGAGGEATLSCGESITGSFSLYHGYEKLLGQFACPVE